MYIWKISKFWLSQYQWTCSYLYAEMSWRMTAPYPFHGAAEGCLESAAADDK